MLNHRDLHTVFVFAAVVRQGSFTSAADELHLTKSVVSGHVRTLEERIGARLLERTTRRMRLTQLGEQVYASAERMIEASREIEEATQAQRASPSGTLRVAATTDLGARFVAPCIATLCRQYPGLDVEAFFADEEVDMIEQGIEVAVRLGVPRDSRLVARKLAPDEEAILASPELAHELRSPKRPRDLISAPWITLTALRRVRHTFHGPRGAVDEIAIRSFRAIAPTTTALRALAREGAGLVIMPVVLAHDDLSRRELVRVLPEWRRRLVGLYVVTPSRAHPPSRVTAFVERLTHVVQAWSRERS